MIIKNWEAILWDCIEEIKKLPENSIDAIVTDPPYELWFMGKSWDNTGIANSIDLWRECLRVLKPGGHLLAFSGTRTYHRMTCAIDDAGFEVRDMIEWVYGSGFPKSLNIGKAVDKLQGNEREVVGRSNTVAQKSSAIFQSFNGADGANLEHIDGNLPTTKGTSEWEGWGTALKPAHEPICMARKPLAEKTVAQNVLKYGTGGINIDESRVDVADTEKEKYLYADHSQGNSNPTVPIVPSNYKRGGGSVLGRFPANLIHDNSEEVRECFPETHWAGTYRSGESKGEGFLSGLKWEKEQRPAIDGWGNTSRFFKSIIYQAKASKSDRNRGCEGLEEKQYQTDWRKADTNMPVLRVNSIAKNYHPTVKPIVLMEYLIKMVSREWQTILDPFSWSFTTALACENTNRKWVCIEKEQEYYNIGTHRITNH